MPDVILADLYYISVLLKNRWYQDDPFYELILQEKYKFKLIFIISLFRCEDIL